MRLPILNQKFTLQEVWALRDSILGVVTHRSKILNFIKITVSSFAKWPNAWGVPTTLMVEPSSNCDMKCPVCAYGQGRRSPGGDMSLEMFEGIIEELGDRLIFLNLWNWGEPLLNRDLPEMISLAKKRKVMVALNTNALLLHDEMARRILSAGPDYMIISFDGVDEETFERIRGKGTFTRVKENVRDFMTLRSEMGMRRPVVDLKMIITRHNEEQIDDLRALSKELGVDKVSFRKLVWRHNPQLKDFLPREKSYIQEIFVPEGIKGCSRVWKSSVILWDGSVVPCCSDTRFQYNCGNLKNGTRFQEIWNNRRYREFRKRTLVGLDSIDICSTCPAISFTHDTYIE